MRSLSLFCLSVSLFLHQPVTAEDPDTQTKVSTETSPLQTVAPPVSDSDASFSVAVTLAASISVELERLSSTGGAIPLPTDIPQYEELKMVADKWPPIQVTSDPLTDEFLAQLRAAGNATSSLERRQGALRVMAVGDSMSHCIDGDFTWRYRIWEWFNSQGIPIDMVGPYIGTAGKPPVGPPQPPPLYGTEVPPGPLNHEGGYAAAFDSNHFANSGRAAGVVQGLIEDVTATYQPDLMLIMLGFNDLAWFYSDGAGLLTSMSNLITNARRAKPDIKFVVGTVPQRPFIVGRADLITNTDEYNRLLRANVPDWNTADSPIVIAPIREEYSCNPTDSCPAAHDGLHPNEQGDFEIARAFSRALVSGLRIGNGPLEVPNPIPWVPLPVPGNIQVFSSPLGVSATWNAVPNVYSYDVDYKINGYQIFMFSPGNVLNNRWDSRWAGEGWTYDIRIRSTRGDKKGEWSAWFSAVAHPETAPVPSNIILHATSTGVDISWTPPTGPYTDNIVLYNVFYFDMDQPCAFLGGAAFQGTSGHLDGLTPGHRYLIGIETWNSVGAGFPGLARNIVPGRGVPGVPQNFRITATDAASVVLQWDKTDGASNYFLWRRYIHDAGSDFQKTDPLSDTCAGAYFQFPGTSNFEWAVSAMNGNDEGPRGPAVRAPDPDGSTAVCPAPPDQCPAGPSENPPAFDPIDGSDPLPPPSGGDGGDDDDDDDDDDGDGEGGDNENDNPQDPTCSGSSCNVCTGTSCQGCEGPSCNTCTGLGCGAGRFTCRGPLCSICKGTDCSGCNSDLCETCTGDDCVAGDHTCVGGGCSFCFGPGCSSCKGGNCETCRGLGCSNSDNRCDDADCSTCVGFCSGSNGGCIGPLCSTCSGVGCSGCTIGPCERCFGEDCLGCNTAGCSTCRGRSCGGCSSDDCTTCSGPSCDNSGNCIGGGCPPGSPPPFNTPPGGGSDPTTTSTACANTLTASNCEVTCTQTIGTTTTSTCSTVTCTPTTGCSVTGTTTTDTTTVGCPVSSNVPYYTDEAQQVVIIGDGGYGGYRTFTGTWTSPIEADDPLPTTTAASPTSTTPPRPTGSNQMCLSSIRETVRGGGLGGGVPSYVWNWVYFDPRGDICNDFVKASDDRDTQESVCTFARKETVFPYYCENQDFKFFVESTEGNICFINVEVIDVGRYLPLTVYDQEDDDNPCSTLCAGGRLVIRGGLLWDDLPDCT